MRNIARLMRNIAMLMRNVAMLIRNIPMLMRNVARFMKNVARLMRNIPILMRNVAILMRNVAILTMRIKACSGSHLDAVQDWQCPLVLEKKDFEKLRQSEKLFARKFDTSKDSDILNMIDKMILSK
ncbi:MAG: hypothetical protein V7K62_15105 [Nostoc sp.]